MGGDHSTDVGGDQSIDVAGDHSLDVAGDSDGDGGRRRRASSTGDAYTMHGGRHDESTTVSGRPDGVGGRDQDLLLRSTDKIVMTCGKATVTMESAGKITLAIDGGASIVLDDKNVNITAGGGGTVTIVGGPMVDINP